MISILSNLPFIIEKIDTAMVFDLFYYILLFEIGSFFHEFGHAAACKKFGATPGGIGFGFYFLMPVLFSDVSDAWKLPPYQRIIVNLGGIYFEMIIATISIILFFFTAYDIWILFPCLLLLDTLSNLNPFLKYDGYWILSDILKISNLHKKVNKTFVNFIRKRKIDLPKKKMWFLIIFEILSKTYIFFLIISMLLINHNSIIYFPNTILNLIFDIQKGAPLGAYKISDFILPILFYFLLIKVTITFVKSKLKKY